MKLCYWDNRTERFEEIPARLPFEVFGQRFCVSKAPGFSGRFIWRASHVETGFCFGSRHTTARLAREEGEKFLLEKGEAKVLQAIVKARSVLRKRAKKQREAA